MMESKMYLYCCMVKVGDNVSSVQRTETKESVSDFLGLSWTCPLSGS